MKITETALPGVVVIQPRLFEDNRGYFFETFNEKNYQTITGGLPFVQDNYSFSNQHVIRGLHYQLNYPQGKLIYVLSGKVFDVVVDIRRGSPHFGKHVSIELDTEKHTQLYIPPGYAHGFCALSDEVSFIYKCTDFYHPEDEKGIRFDDPQLNIHWPTEHAILSDKDREFPLLQAMSDQDLPSYSIEISA